MWETGSTYSFSRLDRSDSCYSVRFPYLMHNYLWEEWLWESGTGSLWFWGSWCRRERGCWITQFTPIQVSLVWRDNTTSVYATPDLEIHHWRSRATSAKMQLWHDNACSFPRFVRTVQKPSCFINPTSCYRPEKAFQKCLPADLVGFLDARLETSSNKPGVNNAQAKRALAQSLANCFLSPWEW
jgi:hypothetical protein